MTDILGHVFYACLFAGQFLITRKSAWGWALRLVGDVGWSVIGLCLGLTCIWAWGLVFIATDVRGFLAWRAPPVDPGMAKLVAKGLSIQTPGIAAMAFPPIDDSSETDEDAPRPHCFDGPF